MTCIPLCKTGEEPNDLDKLCYSPHHSYHVRAEILALGRYVSFQKVESIGRLLTDVDMYHTNERPIPVDAEHPCCYSGPPSRLENDVLLIAE